ncbi:hypothetical protein HLB23_18755 [Nocardia uniformis]|uniref:Uncharacterized protein n=1 Tax=Nocardia uniformis TaxID=53432 RepID=A0A849BZD5_9NOCA|nr:hypothetical protein [Nocardia uniformis]NNH71872.1 hypothetical protein [Nocardia uniformis]
MTKKTGKGWPTAITLSGVQPRLLVFAVIPQPDPGDGAVTPNQQAWAHSLPGSDHRVAYANSMVVDGGGWMP